MRRWLSNVLRWLWLTVETAGRRWPDPPSGPDPFRGRLGLVMVDDRIVTRISEDDLDTLATLVDPTGSSIMTGDTGSPELRTRIPGPRMAERLDLLGVDEKAARQAFDDRVQHSIAFLTRRIADDELTIDPAILVDERSFDERFTVQEWLIRIRETAGTATGTDPQRFFVYPEPDDFWWIHHWLRSMESRAAMRLALVAFPDADVVVRLWACRDVAPDQLAKVSANARHDLRIRRP